MSGDVVDDRGVGPVAEYELVVGSLDVGSLDVGDRHVDDEVFPQYVRRVRRRFLRERIGDGLEGYGWPVVHLEVDFQAELFVGDRVAATVAVEEVGNTSFTTTVGLSRDGERVATARTVHVTRDLEAEKSVPVPEAWRAALDA